MPDAFTLRMFVPDGDPEGVYIDRLTNHVWRSRLLLCWERKFEYAVEGGNLEQQRRSVVSIPN